MLNKIKYLNQFVLSTMMMVQVPWVRNCEGEPAKLDITTNIPWRMSCDFPEELKETTRNAFQFWNKIRDNTFVETDCKDENSITIFFTDSEPDFAFQGGRTNWLLKLTDLEVIDHSKTEIYIFSKVYYSITDPFEHEYIFRHEIGHSLGFQHSKDKGCLMFPEFNILSYLRKNELCSYEKEAFFKMYGKN